MLEKIIRTVSGFPTATAMLLFGATELADCFFDFNVEDLSLIVGFLGFQGASLTRDFGTKRTYQLDDEGIYARTLNKPSVLTACGAGVGLVDSPSTAVVAGVSTAIGVEFLRYIRSLGAKRTKDIIPLGILECERLFEVIVRRYRRANEITDRIRKYKLTPGGYKRNREFKRRLLNKASDREATEFLLEILMIAQENGVSPEEVFGHTAKLWDAHLSQLSPEFGKESDPTKTERLFAKYVNAVVSQPSHPPTEKSGSKRRVRIYKDGIIGGDTLVLKEIESKEAAESEWECAEILRYIQESLRSRGWDPRFEVCRPLAIIEENGKCYYAVEHGRCVPLAEFSNGVRLNYFTQVGRILAAIQAMFPQEKIRGERRSLSSALEERLDPRIREAIVQNLKPIQIALSETRTGYNKDAHPWNFGVSYGERRIVVFDTENARPIEIVYDWVNLLEHTNLLSREERRAVRETIFQTHKEFGADLDKDKYELAYYNATYARALELAGILLERNEAEHARAMINSALYALTRIQLDHSRFYNSFKGEYQHLKQGIEDLAVMIDPNSTG